MKNEFVIDENVIRNAWHGKKPDKTDALAEQKFLRDIFYGEQSIAVSEKIRQKIIKFSKKAEKISKGVDNLVIPLFLKLLSNSTRTKFHTPIRTNFKGVKECDTEFVGVALKSGATLVTADDKLRSAIEKDKSTINCKCMTVEQAISTNEK